jgi:hypothetical protein
MAFSLILDLDRPTAGTIVIKQAPMERALEAIRQSGVRASPTPP